MSHVSALLLQHYAGHIYRYLHVPLYGTYIQAYLPKGQGGRLLARMQVMRYAGMCVSSFLVAFLGTDKRQVAALMHAALALLSCSVTTIIIFAMIRVRAAQAFNGRAVLDVDIFGFEFISSATFRWGSRALTGQDCDDLLDEPDDGADRDLRTGLPQLLRDRELEPIMEESAEGGSLTPMDGPQQSGEGAGLLGWVQGSLGRGMCLRARDAAYSIYCTPSGVQLAPMPEGKHSGPGKAQAA